MLDVEFLMAPAFGARTVYRYRSGVLLPEFKKALEVFSLAGGYEIYRHPPDDFVAGLFGLFTGLHLTDLGGAKLTVIESAMQAMIHHEDGPVAIFLPATSSAFKSATWSELEPKVTVVDEPLISLSTIDAVVHFALSRSDLSPPSNLQASRAFRSYLTDRLEMALDLGDVLMEIDDYILTRVDREDVPSREVDQRVPETSLLQALRAFIRSPDPAETRKLLHRTLLRGDDEKLAIGALSAVTCTLLRQLHGAGDGRVFGRNHEDLLIWSSALLVAHVKFAQMKTGHAPSWRSQPDLRTFGIMELCRDYRADRQDEERLRWLIGRTGRAVENAERLSEVDDRAFKGVISEAQKCLRTLAATPKWCSDLAVLLERKLPTQSPAPIQFHSTLASIEDQAAIVEHLRRRVSAQALDDSILLHGPVPSERLRVASAYAKAAMCDRPVGGDSCGTCETCEALESSRSAKVIVARLEWTDARSDGDDEKTLADAQVEQVRGAIFRKSLWQGRCVVVLDGVDRVRKGALDGMLKAIEASPNEVSFVFLAEQLHQVPAALRSRSTSYKVKPPAGLL